MRRRRLLVAAYLALLAASHAWISSRPPKPSGGPPASAVEVPACDAGGLLGAGAEPLRVAYLHGVPPRGDGAPLGTGEAAEGGALPVVLLHGSPGRGAHMAPLGRALERTGRAWYAPDLPGFGASEPWPPDYSIRAHAFAVRGFLDALGLERAHVVGWSMGGGVALHLTAIAPERVASVALLASIGVQRAEGSGSHAFEHVKYAALYALLVAAPELVPHFGWLGPRARRHAFVRNFWDTDQRPLEALLRGLEHPTLIVQGRQDFLVPAWGAEVSHALAGPSELVMFDGTHFLPWEGRGGALATTLAALEPFLDRAEDPRSAPVRRRVDVSTRPDGRLSPPGWPLEPFELPRRAAWWWSFGALLALSALAPIEAAAVGGASIARLQVDAGVAALACAAGAALRAAARAARGRAGREAPVRRRRLVLAPLAAALGLLPAAVVAAPATSLLSPHVGVFGADLAAVALVAGLGRGVRRWRTRWRPGRPCKE